MRFQMLLPAALLGSTLLLTACMGGSNDDCDQKATGQSSVQMQGDCKKDT